MQHSLLQPAERHLAALEKGDEEATLDMVNREADEGGAVDSGGEAQRW